MSTSGEYSELVNQDGVQRGQLVPHSNYELPELVQYADVHVLGNATRGRGLLARLARGHHDRKVDGRLGELSLQVLKDQIEVAKVASGRRRDALIAEIISQANLASQRTLTAIERAGIEQLEKQLLAIMEETEERTSKVQGSLLPKEKRKKLLQIFEEEEDALIKRVRNRVRGARVSVV